MDNLNLFLKIFQKTKIISLIFLTIILLLFTGSFIHIFNEYQILKNQKEQIKIMVKIQQDLKIEQFFNFYEEFTVPFNGEKLIINERQK